MHPDRARVNLMCSVFRRKFGAAPELWARAPGRVDLMGSHTDYNLGYVLTLPISRDTWMAARARGDGFVRVHSIGLEPDACFPVAAFESSRQAPWSNYVRGVAAVLRERGFPLAGFDAVVHSTVPIGSGLGSSAALECVVAVVFRELGGWTLPAPEMARLCQQAENRFVGVNCGILDQFSSCLGRERCALLLDCRDLSTGTAAIAEGIRVMICDTLCRRQLSAGEYGLRRRQCEDGATRLGAAALRDVSPEQLEARAGGLPPEVLKRCRFIVDENRRVLEMAEALGEGRRDRIARLCEESFAGARDLFEICSPEMLAMAEAARAAPGIIGIRQAGAGFGGCMVAFVETRDAGPFQSAVSRAYLAATGLRPDVFPVEGAAGACRMHLEKEQTA